jgi:hypothetical protein
VQGAKRPSSRAAIPRSPSTELAAVLSSAFSSIRRFMLVMLETPELLSAGIEERMSMPSRQTTSQMKQEKQKE